MPALAEDGVLTAEYVYLTYQKPNSNWGVHVVQVDGEPIKVTGESDCPFRPGMLVTAYGEFVEHPRYGRTFQASDIVTYVPLPSENPRVFADWLRSGAILHLGPVRANAVLAHFGEDTREMLGNPERLQEVSGIGSVLAPLISADWNAKAAFSELSSMLHRIGLRPGESRAATRYFQEMNENARAPMSVEEFGRRVIENPYLLTRARGIGFHRADYIANSLEIPGNSALRLSAALEYAVERLHLEQGHTLLHTSWILEKACGPDILDTAEYAQQLSDILEEKISSPERSGWMAMHPEFVAKTLYHKAESRIWEMAEAMREQPGPFRAQAIESAFRQYPKLIEEQRLAIRAAVAQRIGILTGGPGTGKTTCIEAICFAARMSGIPFKLMAPSGKAAARITEATGYPASTIHRLLGAIEQGMEEITPDTIFIVDEFSMVDSMLAAWLFEQLPSRGSLLMVGDNNQLPSVSPGRVFGDLLDFGLPAGRLVTNHRSREIAGIPRFANMVLERRLPGEPEREELLQTGCEIELYPKGRLTPDDWTEEVVQAVNYLLEEGKAPEDIQVLTPMRRGSTGTQKLNRVLQELLNADEHAARILLGRDDFGPCEWRLGSRVIQLRNDYHNPGGEVFNGEVGYITRMESGLFEATFERDGQQIVNTYTEANIEDVSLAYALTIHKSQGSEYDSVVLVMNSQHWNMLSRPLLYTGVTRAKRNLLVLTESRALHHATQEEEVLRETCLYRFYEGFDDIG